MTQPVQEPTQGRTDQAQEFRTRQLFRRPAPPAAAGGSVAVAVIRYTATALTGANDPLTNFSFRTTDAAVFDTAGGTGIYTGFDGVRFLADGAYTVQCGCAVTSATAADVIEFYYGQGGGSPRGFYGGGCDRSLYPSAGYSNIMHNGWMESHDVNTGSVPAPTDPIMFYVKNRTAARGSALGQVFFTYFGPGDIDV